MGYLVSLAWRPAPERRWAYRSFLLLALAGWLGEASCIRAYGFYAYDAGYRAAGMLMSVASAQGIDSGALSDLREAFNAAIKAIRDDGTYQSINEKYFEYDIYGEDPGA